MESGQPSRTAGSAARYRAAHQILEHGAIFADPLAVRILGVPADELLADAPRRAMRLFIAARTRFAEDALAGAVAGGCRRLVVLGAGLDTFGYRNPYPDLAVVEVDHPDTQAWKRRRLAEAGIAVPESLTYVGVDFERESLADRLRLDGPAFFVWLGVVPYLTRQGFDETLGFVAGRPGNEVVFDGQQVPESLGAEARGAHRVGAGVAAVRPAPPVHPDAATAPRAARCRREWIEHGCVHARQRYWSAAGGRAHRTVAI